MLAFHQMMGNDAETTRKYELDKLKAKVDLAGPKKSVIQIINHWNHLRQGAKNYNANKAVFKKLTGNPVEETFLRDARHEEVLGIVGTSHKNGLSLTTELGLPTVKVIKLPSATVKTMMNVSKRPLTLNSLLSRIQKENITGCTNNSNIPSVKQPHLVHQVSARLGTSNVKEPSSQYNILSSTSPSYVTSSSGPMIKKSAAASSLLKPNPLGSSRLNNCQTLSQQKTIKSTDLISSTKKSTPVSILKNKRIVNHPSRVAASSVSVQSTSYVNKNSASSTTKPAAVSILKSNSLVKNQPAVASSSSTYQHTSCVDTVTDGYVRNNLSDIGLHVVNDSDHGVSFKSKKIMKKRNRTTASVKAQMITQAYPSSSFGFEAGTISSMTKSATYTQYGNLFNTRNRMSSILAEALQKNTSSFVDIQNQLRIANDLKREELEMKKQYYKSKMEKRSE